MLCNTSPDLHLLPALGVLAPDQLYDGGGQRQTYEYVQGANEHELRAFCEGKERIW